MVVCNQIRTCEIEETAASEPFLGGRTRARTWDPMIKRHAIRIDIPRDFFQLSQTPIIADQQLTARNPTVRASTDRCLKRRGFESLERFIRLPPSISAFSPS